MPGDGTRQASTRSDPPPARLLDLTRTLSRSGRRPTGIDRVELAYLDHLLDDAVPVFGLVRTGAGFLLLDETGLRAVQTQLHGHAPWGRADPLSSLFRKRPAAVRRAESDLRRAACDRCRPGRLARLLERALPHGTAYLNVGHSQLERDTLAVISDATGGRVTVLIHDTIPLDFPEFQRPVAVELFAARLRAAQAVADLIICNSRYTESRLRAHLGDRGRAPDVLIAPLGVTLTPPDPSALPDGIDVKRPFFMALGTIEPRKRHDLLLDVWEDLATDRAPGDMPGLLICGARGWNNDAVFSRLDALPKDGPVREMPRLPDGAISALLTHSRGLLFPSEAEGYGLPPLEAAALGTPVVALKLPVYRETLGNKAVYLNETDRYLWKNIVERLTTETGREREAQSTRGFVPPSWADHFDVVFKAT